MIETDAGTRGYIEHCRYAARVAPSQNAQNQTLIPVEQQIPITLSANGTVKAERTIIAISSQLSAISFGQIGSG